MWPVYGGQNGPKSIVSVAPKAELWTPLGLFGQFLQHYAMVLDLGLIACLAPLWRMLRYPSRPSERRRSRGAPTALTTAVEGVFSEVGLPLYGFLRSPGIEKACFSVERRSAGTLVAPVTLE